MARPTCVPSRGRSRLSRTTSLVAALVACVLAGSGALAQTGVATEPPVSPDTAVLTLTRIVDEAISTRAARLGGDPERVRGWVAEVIAPETYDGALKGARGAFLTGAANSADASLLVAMLLQGGAPGVRYRFAWCDSMPTRAVEPSPPFALDQMPAIEAALDPAVASELMSVITELNAYRARVSDRLATSSEDLEQILTANGWQPAAGDTEAGGHGRHAWLQVERDNVWMDLDSTTQTGEPPCVAAETTDDMPDSAWHTTRLRVMAERQSAGSLVETAVLDTAHRTADLATSRMTFGFGEPMGVLEASDADDSPELTLTPVLRIDDTSIVGDPVHVVRPAADEGGGGGLGGFDPFGGGSEPEPLVEVDPVTAMWLDIELVEPSGRARTLRSEVFDRLGPAARAAGTAGSDPPQPLDLVAGSYGAFDATWHIALLVGERRQVDDDHAAIQDLSAVDVATLDGLAATLDALLRLYPAMRRDLGGDSSTPVVLVAGVSQFEGPPKRGGLEPGDVLTRLVLDALLVPARPPTNVAAAARDAAASLAAEEMLVGLVGGDPAPLEDVPTVFAAAKAAGTPWMALRPGDAQRPTGASAAALARIERQLGAGHWVMTPAIAPSQGETTSTAWWFIDPVTGVVRDEHENGRHDMMAEYGGQNAQTSSRWGSFCNFAWGLRRGFVIAAAALFIGTGGAVGGEALKAVVKIVEAQQKGGKTAEEALRIGCPRQGGAVGPPLP